MSKILKYISPPSPRNMVSKYILIGIFSISVFLAGTLILSSTAFAQNVTVHSIFIGPSGQINRTTDILQGTNEEIANQYYKLGEEFDKKTGIKPGDSLRFMFKNKTVITTPYTGEYKNPAAEELLEDVLIPLGSKGDELCWIDEPDWNIQAHWVCG